MKKQQKKTIRLIMSNPPFKLFKFPSRGRPDRFFTSLDSIVNNVSDVDYYHVACTLDLDDETMNNPDVIHRKPFALFKQKINVRFSFKLFVNILNAKIAP